MDPTRTAIESRDGPHTAGWGKAADAARPRLAAVLLALLVIAVLSSAVASAQAPPLEANGKIAFVSFRAGDPEVFRMNADGTQQVRLTNNAGPPPFGFALDFWPSWSSDGAKLVYSSDRGGNLDVFMMNPNGKGQTRITTHPAGDLDPALSGDGKRIVFVREVGEPPSPNVQEIYSVNVDGTGEANLTKSQANETEAAFSPDGKKIVFERDLGGGNHDIFIMNADGTGQKQLTNTPAHEGHPNFSPQGTKIVFDDNFHDADNVKGAIYTMNRDGSGRTKLTNRTDRHGLAAFSPDGKKISFTASEDIWTMNTDGSNQVRLTSHPAPDIQSSWQPPPCVGARATLGRLGFRRIGLGFARTTVARRAGPPKRLARRRLAYCVTDGGKVAVAFSRSGRARLIASTATNHGARRLTPGDSLRRLRRVLRGERRLGSGLYKAPGSRAVFLVRRGRVRAVLVADRGLLRSSRALRAYLRLARP